MDIELQIGPTVTILEIPRERLNEWLLRGYISASKHERRGTRTINIFTFEDLIIIYVFKHLIERGLNRVQSSIICAAMKKNKKATIDPENIFMAFNRYVVTMDFQNTLYKFGVEAMPLEIRFLTNKDCEKTFNTLFVNLDDLQGAMDYSYSNEINLWDTIVINLRLLRDRVESNCRQFLANL